MKKCFNLFLVFLFLLSLSMFTGCDLLDQFKDKDGDDKEVVGKYEFNRILVYSGSTNELSTAIACDTQDMSNETLKSVCQYSKYYFEIKEGNKIIIGEPNAQYGHDREEYDYELDNDVMVIEDLSSVAKPTLFFEDNKITMKNIMNIKNEDYVIQAIYKMKSDRDPNEAILGEYVYNRTMIYEGNAQIADNVGYLACETLSMEDANQQEICFDSFYNFTLKKNDRILMKHELSNYSRETIFDVDGKKLIISGLSSQNGYSVSMEDDKIMIRKVVEIDDEDCENNVCSEVTKEYTVITVLKNKASVDSNSNILGKYTFKKVEVYKGETANGTVQQTLTCTATDMQNSSKKEFCQFKLTTLEIKKNDRITIGTTLFNATNYMTLFFEIDEDVIVISGISSVENPMFTLEDGNIVLTQIIEVDEKNCPTSNGTCVTTTTKYTIKTIYGK